MPMKFLKSVFEKAAHAADIYDKVKWDAQESFDSAYSVHCPAIWVRTDSEAFKFIALVVHFWSEEEDVTESEVIDLTARLVATPSGRGILYSFTGLELV